MEWRIRRQPFNKLKHPGIVKLIDENLSEPTFYAVYEYEPGGSVADLPKEVLLNIPLPQRLQWCEQIWDALCAAHHASVVHRDVKPDNILVSRDRTVVRLCDFGLAFIEGGERHTATLEQVGSRYYIAPELEDGRADQVTTSSDIYSVGIDSSWVVGLPAIAASVLGAMIPAASSAGGARVPSAMAAKSSLFRSGLAT